LQGNRLSTSIKAFLNVYDVFRSVCLAGYSVPFTAPVPPTIAARLRALATIKLTLPEFEATASTR